MYSEKLEGLIDAILADGVITDKEMAILRKRAEAEGEDPDEVEIVVEGRLAKMNSAPPMPVAGGTPVPAPASPAGANTFGTPVAPPPVPGLQSPKPKNDKYGEVRKCPACGAIVEAGTVRCVECDYTFVGIEAVSSVQRFSEILQRIEAESDGPTGIFGQFASALGDKRTRRLKTAIATFPIPNSKEDLIEFLLFLKPKTSNFSGDPDTIWVYKQKYKECVKKAELYFSDDPQVQKILKEKNKKGFGKLFG